MTAERAEDAADADDGASLAPDADGPSSAPATDGAELATIDNGVSLASSADGTGLGPDTKPPSLAPDTQHPSAASNTSSPSLAPDTHRPSSGPNTDPPSLAPSTNPPSLAPGIQHASVLDRAAPSGPPSTTPAPGSGNWSRTWLLQTAVVLGFACAGGLLGYLSAKRDEQRALEQRAARDGNRGKFDAPIRSGANASVPGSSTETSASAVAQPTAAPPPAAVAPTLHDAPGFLDRAGDAELLAALSSDAIVAAKKGSGGRSLAFKLGLASGIKAYFKPEQSVSSARWYAEVAAYHLDRALGLGRVPPVVSRSFRWSALRAAAGDDPRASELTLSRDGLVRGALIYWIDGRLVAAVTPPGWENWVRSERFGRTTVSPYQRASAYGEALARAHGRRVRQETLETFYDTVPTPLRNELPAELSDMILFDFLTLNYDRFGGDNANILELGEAGPLLFLDNGDGFSPGPPRRSVIDARLAPLSRFRKRTVEALRAFDTQDFSAQLAREPLAPILDTQALNGLAARRQIVLEHVAAQQRRFGDAVFAW